MSGRHLAFPFRIGADGRTVAPADLSAHVRGEMIQLLLTAQGERPFLPSFGAGLRRLVFERNDDATAGVVRALLTQNLSRWLGHRVAIERVDVRAGAALMRGEVNDAARQVRPGDLPATLAIDLRYRVIATGEVRDIRFERSGTD